MRKALKESKKSTNFWNNAATIASMILIALSTVDFSNLTVQENIDMKDLLIVVAYNVSNILYHMSKNPSINDESSQGLEK